MLLSVVGFQFLGTGLVLPFLVVYLHEIRGFALSDVGLLIGLRSADRAARGRAGRRGHRQVRRPRRRDRRRSRSLVAADVVLAFAETLGRRDGRHRAPGRGVRRLLAGVPEPDRRRRAQPSSGSATSGSTSPCSTSASGSAASSAGSSSTSHRPATFQVIYLADAVSYLPGLFLLLVPLRHLAGRPVHDDDRRRRRSATSQVLRRPAVADDAAQLRVVVRRLLPAQRRPPGVRPRGRADLRPRVSASPTPATRW